jgi:pimeloyl-ACP methyl ester carboxylesterase
MAQSVRRLEMFVASFILIHGAWHGGWCFGEVKALLEACGHEVITPDLPGMGSDEETMRAVTLAGWGEFVAGLCRAATQRPVVLAGHSRGGIVISEAAEAAPDAIDALVYICALMLPHGMSQAEFHRIEGPDPDLAGLIIPIFDGAASLVDPTIAPRAFAQLSPPDKVAAMVERLVAEPRATLWTPMRITPERFGRIPRTYIECTQDRAITLDGQRMMQKLVPGAHVVTFEADHSPYLCMPQQLADALIAAAEEVSS